MYLFGSWLAGPQTSKREKQPTIVEDIKKKKQGRDGDISVIMCLPCKHKDLSSIPINHVNNMGAAACTCNSRSSQIVRKIPGAGWPASLARSTNSRFSEKTCL